MQTNTQHSETLYYDPESEIGFLQSLYLEPDLLYQTDVKTSDILNHEHRQIYETLLKLYADGIAFELKTLKDANLDIDLKKAFDIFNTAVTSANIHYYADKIKMVSFNRKSREIINKLQGKIGEDDFLIEAQKAVTELESHQYQKYPSIAETLSQIKTNIAQAQKLKHYGIQTHFKKLDEAIVGLCLKHFLILAGYTSYGKSTWLCQLISNICEWGARVLLFSVEDSKEDKLVRLLATRTGIPIRTIMRGYGDENELRIAMEEIKEFNLHIYDDCYTIEEMNMRIRKHILQGGVDIVCIDFLQNIITKGEDIFTRMSRIAIELQRMAKRHNVCILGLSQITTSEEKGKIALRGAQELASASDIVLWLDRKPDERAFDLIIRKNRPFGKTGKIPMTFNETWTGIKEI